MTTTLYIITESISDMLCGDFDAYDSLEKATFWHGEFQNPDVSLYKVTIELLKEKGEPCPTPQI
jgi:hypothetical protein